MAMTTMACSITPCVLRLCPSLSASFFRSPLPLYPATPDGIYPSPPGHAPRPSPPLWPHAVPRKLLRAAVRVPSQRG
eukprot:8630971-Pyramimonas_sp.AAC.1